MDGSCLQEAVAEVEILIAASQARIDRLRKNIERVDRDGGNTDALSELLQTIARRRGC